MPVLRKANMLPVHQQGTPAEMSRRTRGPALKPRRALLLLCLLRAVLSRKRQHNIKQMLRQLVQTRDKSSQPNVPMLWHCTHAIGIFARVHGGLKMDVCNAEHDHMRRSIMLAEFAVPCMMTVTGPACDA